jgi:hypothetical protein
MDTENHGKGCPLTLSQGPERGCFNLFVVVLLLVFSFLKQFLTVWFNTFFFICLVINLKERTTFPIPAGDDAYRISFLAFHMQFNAN